MKCILILILIAAAASVLIIAFVRIREGGKIRKDLPAARDYDAILVLGCGVYSDGSLSPMLRYRLEKTVELYRNGAADRIYVTGDHRQGEYDEVDHMMEYLVSQGVPEQAMTADYAGHSTGESMAHAAQDLAGQRVIIVTQQYHLYRAMYIGEAYGLSCDGAAAQDWGLSSGTVFRHARELAATLKDFFACLIKR